MVGKCIGRCCWFWFECCIGGRFAWGYLAICRSTKIGFVENSAPRKLVTTRLLVVNPMITQPYITIKGILRWLLKRAPVEARSSDKVQMRNPHGATLRTSVLSHGMMQMNLDGRIVPPNPCSSQEQLVARHLEEVI